MTAAKPLIVASLAVLVGCTPGRAAASGPVSGSSGDGRNECQHRDGASGLRVTGALMTGPLIGG